MSDELMSFDVPPSIPAPLDRGFRPAALANRTYRSAVSDAGGGVALGVALERNDGLVERHDLRVLPPGSGHDDATRIYIDRHIKFLLWSRGGWKIVVSGPDACFEPVSAAYTPGGARAFDAAMMGRVYDRDFVVVHSPPEEMPDPNQAAASIGGRTDGCRIGFDLGASDYKIAAVIDGEPVFSTELPWDPVPEPDPAYHLGKIREGLELAASHLPRVDAIGGSSAGILVGNRIKVASLFRSVPEPIFSDVVGPLFVNLQKEWKVPLVVANDGDVTALAGAMALGKNAMLGVAMGSSEAAGYLDPDGCITGWLNELAFAPVDFSAAAAADEWSGDQGVGVQYFSQQAVNKLSAAAGISFPDDMSLAERLKEVQDKMAAGDKGAHRIFETIGVYLGYTIGHYADYYDFENLLILGRVTSGAGGNVIREHARRVLQQEFSELADSIALVVPDEATRRVGQAVAAASLPQI